MSLNDEIDKRYRSIRLCQLACDRQIDSDISYEIRKLLEKGVLIDFQDQNRNKRTALHLAVDKFDVTCVKFLLRYKPSLEVKDENGKTPLQLAELNGNRRVLDILLNSTVDVVNESCIEKIDFESLARQKIEAIKLRSTFKVLKLINCPSVKEVWMKLIDHNYVTALNESSYLFFIAIETNETNIQNNHELMKKVLNLRQPMIVQLTSANSQITKIYFKDEKKDFLEITDTPQITQEKFNKLIESQVGFSNMKLLVAALRSNLFGHFSGDLLEAKLNNNEDRNEAVNKFAKSNALCHRFFKLFDKGQAQIDRIVATLSFNGDQSFLAFLDLPFEPKGEKLKLNEYQQDILSVVDSSGCNLLMMAVEQSHLNALKLLLRCGCDFNHSDNYDNRASDICWETKAFGCLVELIEAGSPYPNNFCIDEVDESSEAYERINAMIEAINSFHENIKQGETEEVETFIASHPHIKHAYDINNKCALTVALQSNRVDIYSLLMSEGFEPGADDEYQSACSKSKFKNDIRNSHRKYFKDAFSEPHLKRLLDKFKLSFGSKDRAKCSKIIRKMFEELNEIDEVIPILKICSLSDKLRIVFDFSCDSVEEMDPTKDSSSLGAVYPSDGFIYIGAINHETEFCLVIGNLIHEMTHYAMKLTYGNSCKPYNDGDSASAQIFDNISTETKKICDENPSTDPIVTTVFNCYTNLVWHAELIVRVPQLLAHYKMQSETRDSAERNTPELFHFYREKTLKDVERQSKAQLNKYLISKINNQTGISREIESLNVKFEKVEIDLKPSINIIASNAPRLTLAMLGQIDSDDSHIFVSLKQVAIGNILTKIAKVNAKQSSTALIVDCLGQAQKYPESLRKLLKDMKNMETIALVMTEAESSKVKETFPEVEPKTYDHKWSELTESSKEHLLDQNVKFQGVEMKLSKLVEPSSDAMNFFPLGDLVDCKDFRIGTELNQTSHKFYIPRQFIGKGQAKAKSFEELLRDDPKMGSMMISDEAGSGKSVALFEVATCLHGAFPDRWVLFVDLKRHIIAFKGVQDYKKIESFEDFILQIILKNEPKFDRELFMKMFRAGKTFVLFDGFDEISPSYKKLFLHCLKLFESWSGSQLFITTRPHLEADLEAALGKFVFKLEEFSEESQKSFLKQYWQSVGLEIGDDDFEALSERLLEKFSGFAASKLIGLPLLMRMTAEIFDDPIKENLLQKVYSLSVFSVFNDFVQKYIARWTNNENEISRSENVGFVMAGGVLEVHHNIALNHILDVELMNFDDYEDESEKIARLGLVRYDKTEKSFQFIHETFAEYFVAHFIWFHLDRKNRNPSHDCSMAIKVLVEVLCGQDFYVIRNFLDQALALETKFNPREVFCKSMAKCFSEILKSKNRFDLLRRSMEPYKCCKSLISLLLAIAKHVEKDVLLKMLQSKESSSKMCVLHYAVDCGSIEIVSTLCDIITTCTENPKEIYQDEGYSRNVLFTAAHRRDDERMLTTLCANLNSVLTKDEIKIMFQRVENGRNIIALATDMSTDAVFLELLALLPDYFSPDEIKILLRAVDGRNRNFFQSAVVSNTNESLKLKFDAVKTNFEIEGQKTFFYQPVTDPNMFHWAAETRNEKIFEAIIESTCDVLSDDDIKSMLKGKDPEGSNVLHYIAARGNEVTLNELNLLLRQRLSDDDIRSLLLEVNEKSQNCFGLVLNNAELEFQVFHETIGNLVSIDDQTRLLQQSIHEIDIILLACENVTMDIVPLETIKELLTKIDRKGRNAFLKVAHRGNADTWNKLISFAQIRFSADEMKSFLYCFDENGENCLHLASYNWSGKANMIEAICSAIKTVLNAEDRKEFFKQKESNKRNVFQQAAMRFHIEICYSLYHELGAELSKEMLLSAGDNILFFPKNGTPADDEASRKLITFLQEVLTNDEIKKLLFEVDGEGKNFFRWPVEYLEPVVIKSVSKAIKEVLNQDDQTTFFGIKSPNIFHLAAANLNPGTFSTVLECLKEVLTANEIKGLLLNRNSENKNTLHLLCVYNASAESSFDFRSYRNGEKRLLDFLKVLKVAAGSDELKNFLTSSDNNGSTCLLLAAQLDRQTFIKELFSFIRSELSVDDQRDFFQKCDNDGKNIFTYASLNNDSGILAFVKQFAIEILSEFQIEILMNRHLENLKKK